MRWCGRIRKGWLRRGCELLSRLNRLVEVGALAAEGGTIQGRDLCEFCIGIVGLAGGDEGFDEGRGFTG